MEVRRLRPGDEEEAIAAVRDLKDAPEPRGGTVSPEQMRRLLGADTNYLYVATLDDTPIGFLIAYRMPRIDRDQEMVCLYEIGVDGRYRRRGVGTALIEALKHERSPDRIMKIWTCTEADNVAARSLYESTGSLRRTSLSRSTFIKCLADSSASGRSFVRLPSLSTFSS